MRKNDDDEGRFCDPIEKDEFCSVCESSWIGGIEEIFEEENAKDHAP